jgi:hypothetical protein
MGIFMHGLQVNKRNGITDGGLIEMWPVNQWKVKQSHYGPGQAHRSRLPYF